MNIFYSNLSEAEYFYSVKKAIICFSLSEIYSSLFNWPFFFCLFCFCFFVLFFGQWYMYGGKKHHEPPCGSLIVFSYRSISLIMEAWIYIEDPISIEFTVRSHQPQPLLISVSCIILSLVLYDTVMAHKILKTNWNFYLFGLNLIKCVAVGSGIAYILRVKF